MLLPTVIFLVFALLAAAGAYLGGTRYRGQRTGLAAALAALVFFAALYAGLIALLRSGGAF
jgi:hypothetical protein